MEIQIIYKKGRKSGNFKKLTPEEEAKTALDIKREEKRQFREMLNKLINEKPWILTQYINYMERKLNNVNIYLSLYNGSNYSKIN